jgi:hypothetical protein
MSAIGPVFVQRLRRLPGSPRRWHLVDWCTTCDCEVPRGEGALTHVAWHEEPTGSGMR